MALFRLLSLRLHLEKCQTEILLDVSELGKTLLISSYPHYETCVILSANIWLLTKLLYQRFILRYYDVTIIQNLVFILM